MLNAKRLEELRKAQNFSKLSWVFGDSTAKELLDTLSAALKVVEAAKKLIVHCNHKPEGWDELDKTLAPFSPREGNDEEKL